MSIKNNIKKAMATTNFNSILCDYSENIGSIRLQASIELDALKLWDDEHNYADTVRAGMKKHATIEQIKRAENIKIERAEYRASLPYGAIIRGLNADCAKAVTTLCGAKKSARYALVEKAYNEYVASAGKFSATHTSFETALGNILLHADGLNLRTDAKTARNMAGRLANMFGMSCASTTALGKGTDVHGLSVLTLAQFRKLLVRGLSALAVSGTVDLTVDADKVDYDWSNINF